MVKLFLKRKLKTKLKRKYIKKYLKWAFVAAFIILMLCISYLAPRFNGPVAGKAFSYKQFAKMPFHFTNLAKGNEYGFTYNDVIYKLKIKDVDVTNKKIKYEISKAEVDVTEEGAPDIYIDHISVEKVDEPYIYFKIILKNKGTKDVYDKFFVTLNSLDEDDGVYATTYQEIEGLDQGEEINIFASIKYDKNYYNTNGKIKYEVNADSSSIIKESDETNNKEEDYYNG